MKKNILLCILALIALCGCANQAEKPSNDPKGCDDGPICDTGKQADMSVYEGFMDEKHQFVKTQMSDFLLKLDANASGVYYFGYASCPWCVEAIPILNDIAKQKDMPIYYIDKKAETSTAEEIKKVESRLGDRLELDEEGNPHLYVPFVVAIAEGEVRAYHTGTVDEHDAHERKMTAEEVKELTQIYEDLFASIE